MGKITSLFVRKIVAQAGAGVDRRALLLSVGLDPEAGANPDLMIEDTDYYELIEGILAVDPAAVTLGLRTGASMRCDDYGALGLAFKSALTLRSLYLRLERYSRVLSTVATYSVRDEQDGVYASATNRSLTRTSWVA